MISGKTIGRLSLYRRLLNSLLADGEHNIYSHQLAKLAGGTAAQVRRDVMAIGYTGSPVHGYGIRDLIKSIADFLDAPEGQNVALVGIGNLGRAILTYFTGRRPRLSIVAAFDVDPAKINRTFHGCRCFPVADIHAIIPAMNIDIGIITVPAENAQSVAEILCDAGIHGILNFAPVRLALPETVYVEDLDVTTSLEKVAFFARMSHPTSDTSSG